MKDFVKYIEISDAQATIKSGTTPGLPTMIKEAFFDAHKEIGTETLCKIWKSIYEALMYNEALCQFVIDYNAAESSYFFPWLKTLATSPSAALEMAYGAGFDLKGNWEEHIPENDPIAFFVHNMPTLVYNRERQLKVADLVVSDQEMATPTRESKVIDLGAGRMAWARHHGLRFKPQRQSIYACDVDPNIPVEQLFPYPKRMGLTYEQAEITSVLGRKDLSDATLALLLGVASYFSTDIFREKIVKPIYQMLTHGGSFFFDLQLECTQYVWSVKVTKWPELKLAKTAAEAIEVVETMRRQLWKEDMKFSADYALDTYNEFPSSVMVTMTKL